VTLPAFATVEDFADRLPGGLDDADEPRAQALLEDASSLIRTAAGVSWVSDDVLDFGDLADWKVAEIARITIAAATRAFTNPDRATAMTVGDTSVTLADSSPDVYLTAAERAAVLAMVGIVGGVPGLASVRVIAPAAASGSRYYTPSWDEDDDE
jgi:hypothetical protein